MLGGDDLQEVTGRLQRARRGIAKERYRGELPVRLHEMLLVKLVDGREEDEDHSV